jgi:proteasome lid subunit RPN8/RPN11
MRRGTAGRGLTAVAADEVAGALRRVAALAEAEPEREVCGFLVRRGGALEVWPACNVAADPARAFEMAPADVLSALRRVDAEGLVLSAVYHSHPGGGPALSPRDVARLAPGGEPLLAGVDLVVIALADRRAHRARIHQWCDEAFSHRDVPLTAAADR